MKRTFYLVFIGFLYLYGCGDSTSESNKGSALASKTLQTYLDFSERDDQFTGGIKMIPITTPRGEFRVWTKQVGNNPDKKVLLLHGGCKKQQQKVNIHYLCT